MICLYFKWAGNWGDLNQRHMSEAGRWQSYSETGVLFGSTISLWAHLINPNLYLSLTPFLILLPLKKNYLYFNLFCLWFLWYVQIILLSHWNFFSFLARAGHQPLTLVNRRKDMVFRRWMHKSGICLNFSWPINIYPYYLSKSNPCFPLC